MIMRRSLFILFLINMCSYMAFDIKDTILNPFKRKNKDKLGDLKKCRVTHNGLEYEGNVAQTKSGILCQNWETPDPIHKLDEHIVDADFPEGSRKKAKNYCRNPRYWHGRPWCYTMAFNVTFEECDVPLCIKEYCRLTGPGVEYAGLSHALGQKECVYWSDLRGTEYKELRFDSLFPDGTRKKAENRCRNPDSDVGGPWCFVEAEFKEKSSLSYEKAYCGVPLCEPKPCMTAIAKVSSGYKNYHSVFSLLPQNTTSIDFSVKLWKPDEWQSSELKLALTLFPMPATGGQMRLWGTGIEINISTYKSGLTPKEGEESDWNVEAGLLSGTHWQDLELSWAGGFISLKIKGKTMAVFTKDYSENEKDLSRGRFLYYSIKGSHALWNFPFCSSDYVFEEHVTTHGDFDRRWSLPKGTVGLELKFFVRGFHTAIIELKSAAMIQYPSIQLTLMNRKSANFTTLTLKDTDEDNRITLMKIKVETLLSFWEWREFVLNIDGPRLELYWIRNSRAEKILSAINPKIETLKWFSIGSRQSTVHWSLNGISANEKHKIPAELPECVMSKEEKEYSGFQSVTETGLTCVPWDDPTGHVPQDLNDSSFVDGSKENAKNYCRNPTGSVKGPYCYAVDLSDSGYTVKKEYCFPRQCRSKECKMSGTGNDYIGSLSVTISGRTCQRWTSTNPHTIPQKLLIKEMFPELSLSNVSNFCRNPSHDTAGLWCYTSDLDVDTDLCNVPDCDVSGACTVLVKGNITRQSVFILPLWRTYGLFFKAKSWDPKWFEGVRFTIRSSNNITHYQLDLGAGNNDKIILYYINTVGEQRIVKQKTVAHVIPSGHWAGFVLVLGFGEIGIKYEHVPKFFFEWKYTWSEGVEPIQPRYLSYSALSNIYSVGIGFTCEECHTHITQPGLIENIYPLKWWKPDKHEQNTTNLTLYVRGTGTFLLVLIRLIKTFTSRILIELSDYGHIVVKDEKHVLADVRKEVSVSEGTLIWNANCDPPNIDATPVDGGWSNWGPWQCSVTCGGGHGKRKRLCDYPKPNLFGEPCNGSDVMEGICNDFKCGDIPPDLYKLIAERITQKAHNVRRHVGENLSVLCDQYILTELRDVSPSTNIEWTKNGMPLFPQQKINNITIDLFQVKITETNLNDSGIYICALEDQKGEKAVIQLTSVTIITNISTKFARQDSTMVLNCQASPLSYIFSDLTQFWTLNGKLFKDYGATSHNLLDIDLLSPINKEHEGEWECVTVQVQYNLTWVTTWFKLRVMKNTVLAIIFDNIFLGKYFRLFGDNVIINSIFLLMLLITVVILVTIATFVFCSFWRKKTTYVVRPVINVKRHRTLSNLERAYKYEVLLPAEEH